MKVTVVIFLGLLLFGTVKSDLRRIRPGKLCEEGPSQVSGGSLDQMIAQQFPCNVEATNVQQDESDEVTVEPTPSTDYSPDIRYEPKRSQEIALSVLDLSQRLVENIVSKSTKKYEILSPISIASALQLALLGAHGMTFSELMDLMDYNSKSYSQYPSKIHEEFGLLLDDLTSNSPNPSRFRSQVPWRTKAPREYLIKAMKFQSSLPNYDEHKINVANGIFVQSDFSIRSEYKDVVESVYQSVIKRLDFRREPQQAAKYINDWVNEKTNGKIKEILPGSANTETRVILVNALYFNAEWQHPFIEGATGFKKFYPQGKESNYTVQAELMAHGGNFPHYYDPESDCEILGFPYKQNATTMYVILPKNSNPEKLREAQKILTAEKIEKMISLMTVKTAVVLFPKMHMSCGHHLKAELQEIGLRTLFKQFESDLSVLSNGNSRENTSQNLNEQLIFGRNGGDDTHSRDKRDVTYKTAGESSNSSPLTMKDFMLRKKIVKKAQGKKQRRSKRQLSPFAAERLDMIRHRKDLPNPQLFAEEVIHKVDLTINEKGTEGGAATAISLNRSGTKVVFRVDTPFMFLIRHDPTRLALFYGVVFEPQNQ